MTWTKLSPALILLLVFLQGCGIYSFSGISLSPEVKTFSLSCQSNVALGPPDLSEQFKQRLGDELVQRTPLKQVTTEGDLQLEVVIKKFTYVPIAPTSKKDQKGQEDQASGERLTIEVQMNYSNPYNEASSFSKKIFSQNADMPANESRSDKESDLIKEIFTKLIKGIFNETVASW